MLSVDFLWTVWIVLACIGLFLILTYYPLLYILHRVLSKRLDPIMLKGPYFNRTEQFNYQFFPLYLVKAVNYIALVAWPTLAKKRRFRGAREDLPISPALRAVCIIQFTLMWIGALAYLVLMALVTYTWIVFE